MTVQHEHSWHTASRHPTSEGMVSYQRCGCGAWQVLVSAATVVTARPARTATPRA
jgi:hypothetical protein